MARLAGLIALLAVAAGAVLPLNSAQVQINDLMLEFSLVGRPDNTVTADGTTVTVAAKLTYPGDSSGTLNVADLAFRVSGSLEWDVNGRSSLRISDQSISCAASSGQVSCPLDLTTDQRGDTLGSEITTPECVSGAFTISATARVGGQTAHGSLLVTIVEDAPPEPTRPEPAVDAEGGFAFKLALVGQSDNAAAAGETIDVAASLVYAGSAVGAGSRAVSGIRLRVSGAFEWEANGRSGLEARDQTARLRRRRRPIDLPARSTDRRNADPNRHSRRNDGRGVCD